MSGWFSVKRGITSHPIFKGHPERLAIWLWLLDNVAWQDTSHDVRGHTITVPRGSVCASERRIAAEVGVGYQVVRTFLARLKTEHMINAEVTHGRNLISLCNWAKYQTPPDAGNAEGNAQLTQSQRTKETREQYIPVGAGADAPPRDPAKAMWDSGVSLLTGAGMKDKQARSLIGKWNRDYGQASVIAAIGAAVREGPAVPVEFIEKALQWRAKKAEPEIGEVRTIGGRKRIYNGKQDGWITIHEDDDADSMGNPAGSGDQHEQDQRDDADDMPRMQSAPEEQDGSLPLGDVQAGRGGVELLALRVVGGAVL